MSGCCARFFTPSVDRVLVYAGDHHGVGRPKLPAPALTPGLVYTAVTPGARRTASPARESISPIRRPACTGSRSVSGKPVDSEPSTSRLSGGHQSPWIPINCRDFPDGPHDLPGSASVMPMTTPPT
jgi:hypothetical protein